MSKIPLEKPTYRYTKPVFEFFSYAITFGLSIYINFYAGFEDKTEAAIKAIFVLFAGFSITQVTKSIFNNWDFFRHADSMEERIHGIDNRINRFVDQVSDCRYVGRADEAYEEVAADLRKSSSIKNTCVLFGIKTRVVPQDIMNQRAKYFKDFLEARKSWEDIVSPSVWEKRNEHINKGYSEIIDSQEYIYEQRVLCLEYPIINFVIFYYSGPHSTQSKKVYFGWGHHHSDPNGHVFSSENSNVVDMFEKYWDCIKLDTIPIHDYIRYRGNQDSIIGHWANVAYRKTEKEEDSDFWNNALVYIELNKERELVVTATIYDRKRNKIGSFHSTSARFFDNQLYYSYERTSVSADDDSVTNAAKAVMHLSFSASSKTMRGTAFIGGITGEIEIFCKKMNEEIGKSIEEAAFDLFDDIDAEMKKEKTATYGRREQFTRRGIGKFIKER